MYDYIALRLNSLVWKEISATNFALLLQTEAEQINISINQNLILLLVLNECILLFAVREFIYNFAAVLFPIGL